MNRIGASTPEVLETHSTTEASQPEQLYEFVQVQRFIGVGEGSEWLVFAKMGARYTG